MEKSILITGKQGTGKTTKMEKLISEIGKEKIFKTIWERVAEHEFLPLGFLPLEDIVAIDAIPSIKDIQMIIDWKNYHKKKVIAVTQVSIFELLESDIDLFQFQVINMDRAKKDPEVLKNCECIKTVADNIVKRMSERERKPDGYEIIRHSWENEALMFGSGGKRLYTVYNIESTFKKVNGSTSKPKKEKINVTFSFCPFCGKKIN
jgi:hypothetical protein